jgi:ferritin-like metal-binding protein YciE
MVQATANAQLAAAFQAHLEQTKEQANRLENFWNATINRCVAPRDKGMERVLTDGAELLDAESGQGVR